MKKLTVEYYQSESDGQWYWRLTSRNGKTRCQGEGHPTRANARRAFRTIVKDLREGEVVEVEQL
jgi:uncharacterized protein YegP (UPF0339 family)